MKKFALENVTCGYKDVTILSDVSFSIGPGEALCLLGPNGVGKTTLFRSMLGFLKPFAGKITLDGDDISTWSSRTLAKKIGYVPQNHTPPFAYPVIDVVTMGRLSRISPIASPSSHDIEKAYECLERLGISHLAEKLYTQISGGERQMVLIARSLAQEPEVLVMDEPTASLDYGNQVKVLRQISHLVKEGISVIMTTHFPDHAFLCATKVGLITRDWVRFGEPDKVVTEDSLKETYGVDVRIVQEHSCTCGMLKGCIPIVEFAAGEKHRPIESFGYTEGISRDHQYVTVCA
ncbi:MAG: ABC transporter ATP-binding protein [Raoultibacter sp.]